MWTLSYCTVRHGELIQNRLFLGGVRIDEFRLRIEDELYPFGCRGFGLFAGGGFQGLEFLVGEGVGKCDGLAA